MQVLSTVNLGGMRAIAEPNIANGRGRSFGSVRYMNRIFWLVNSTHCAQSNVDHLNGFIFYGVGVDFFVLLVKRIDKGLKLQRRIQSVVVDADVDLSRLPNVAYVYAALVVTGLGIDAFEVKVRVCALA